MNNIDSNIGEIVMYQPDETIRLEVKTGNHMFTTIWIIRKFVVHLQCLNQRARIWKRK